MACGFVFAVAHFVASNHVSAQLADLGAVLLGRARSSPYPTPAGLPPNPYAPPSSPVHAARTSTNTTRRAKSRARTPRTPDRRDLLRRPDPGGEDRLAGATQTYDRPFPNVADPDGEPVANNVFTWPIVSTGGTLVLLAGLCTAVVPGVHARVAVRQWAATVHELRCAILTVTSVLVLVLAHVMNLSAQAATIDHFVAAAGAGLAFLSPLLGWSASRSRALTPPPTHSSAPSRSARPASRACRPNCSPPPTAPAGSSASDLPAEP